MRSWISVGATALAASFAALVGAPTAAAAQGTATVQGIVTDSTSRRPVAGVQVVVTGTTRGALTDDAGRYAIRGVPSGEITLRAHRLGFTPTERRLTVGAGETATADFVLRAVATVLSEVVVTGYGTSSRAEVSSAVAQVSGEAIANRPVASVDAALQGKAPGVQVVSNAGNPGNGITVRIRGSASLSASNQPLYVVDGVPIVREDLSALDFGGQELTSITGLSPDEIESIDILKDAAAAAIYGSRGSNGVIQITTKRGRPGRTRFSFNSYYGTQGLAKKVALLNAKEYVEFFNEGGFNDGYCGNVPSVDQCDPADLTDAGLFVPGVDDQIDTDWQAAIMRTAPIGDLNLSVNGGSDRITYLLSGSFFDQMGLIYGSDYDRANGRLNVDFTANNRLSFRTSLGVARERWHRIENDNTILGPGTNALAVQPNIAPRRADGSYTDNSTEGLEYANPLANALEWNSPATSLRAIGGIDAMFDISDRLRFTGRLGADVNSFRERQWQSPLAPDTYAASVNGVANQGTNVTTRYLTEGFLTFDPVRAADQRLTLTGGGGFEYNRTERTFVTGEGFPSNLTQYPGSAGKITFGDGNATGHNLLSAFARANYALRDRYLLSASFRADGSSRFGENSRWGLFPAVSLGWQASQEPFLAGLKRLADLKLRASYGVTGNQGISSNFAFLRTFSKASFAGEPGLAPGNFGNPDLRWEQTTEFDVGFDLSFLEGRVAVIGDYYRKLTSDLLITRPITSTTGYTSVWDNVGNIENQGVELQVSATAIQARRAGEFDWRADFNISHNRNRVTKLHGGEPFNRGIRSVSRVEEGQPLGAFHVIRFDSVGTQDGQAYYHDLNGDGAINAEDRMIVGSPHPDYWGGFRNQLSWRGFDLNTFLEFSQGAEVFNLIRIFADDGGYYFDNKFKHVLRRWRQPGDQTDVPRASFEGTSGARTVSSRFVEDASYVRLQEVTLGYRLPSGIAAMSRLADARVYVSGRNLKLWTNYMGY
ncbi:MAG: TonB-dependent receptor, partial [Gemmatimonadota bacterium]|nr:TonB-dependent receptor [Gemmatimonadota bacterium]